MMTDWIEVIIRSFSLLVVLFIITKILGKKSVAQLSTFELIAVIVFGVVGGLSASMVNFPIFHGLLTIFIWFGVLIAAGIISIKSKTFRNIFLGESTVMIQNGKIMEDNLKKENYSADDLLQNLRTKDIFNVADVEFAVLEPSGTLNVLPKKDTQPITAKDIGIKVAPEKAPETVVMDGKMLLEPLANLSLNPNWLETELDKLNVSIENVFLAQADQDGQLTVDLYDDQIVVPEPSEKPLLLATLKKCQADLELFALETENITSKEMYEKNSKKIQQVINMIEPFAN